MPRVSLQVKGLSCTGCIDRLRAVLMPSHCQELQLDLLTGKGTAVLEDVFQTKESLFSKITDLGYTVLHDELEAKEKAVFDDSLHFWFTLPMCLEIVASELFSSWFLPHDSQYASIAFIVNLAMLSSIIFVNRRMLGWRGMSLLLSLNTAIGLLSKPFSHVYDLSGVAVMWTSQCLAAKWKQWAKREALAYISGLQSIQIEPMEEAKGQILELLGGQVCPVDGTILDWSMDELYVDTRILTGEPEPRLLRPGEEILAGFTVLNANKQAGGKVQVKVSGKDTQIGQLITALTKFPTEDQETLTNQMAQWFVPFILACGAITLIAHVIFLGSSVHQAIMFAMGVMSVACPCTLALAVPMVNAVGRSLAAKEHGILFLRSPRNIPINSNGGVLVVFDKTGTLTVGKPTVIQHCMNQSALYDEKYLAAAIVTLERQMDHPVSRALIKHFEPLSTDNNGLQLAVENYTKLDRGIQGIIKGRLITIEQSWDAIKVSVDSEEQCRVWLAGDHVRPEAVRLIHWLKANNYATALMSGDAAKNCEQIAREVGIDTVYGHCTPARKSGLVKLLKTQYSFVMFVGDGVNDALAMAEADLGIAMPGCPDLVGLSAGVALLDQRKQLLEGVKETIRLSQHITTWQSRALVTCCLYNTLAVPVASGLFPVSLPHVLCAPLMALSTVSVCGCALLTGLFYKKQPMAMARPKTKRPKGSAFKSTGYVAIGPFEMV